jgi:chemotaxis signal transduction protein
MSHSDNLISMQKQNLEKLERFLSEQHNEVNEILKNPSLYIQSMMKFFHDMRENIQAIGLIHYASLIHDFETVLAQLLEYFLNKKDRIDKEFIEVVKMKIHEILNIFESYFQTLKELSQDKIELYNEKKIVIDNLNKYITIIISSDRDIESKFQKQIINSQDTLNMSSETYQYLICRTGKTNFAIPIHQISEIIEGINVNILPFSKGNVLGFIVYRGEPLVILQTNDFQQADMKKKHLSIVIVKINEFLFGFAIESVEVIEKINPSDIQCPDVLQNISDKSWVVGISEKKILILNLEKAIVA